MNVIVFLPVEGQQIKKKLDLASLCKRTNSSLFRNPFPAIAKQQRNKD
jgi:hypothetical protein